MIADMFLQIGVEGLFPENWDSLVSLTLKLSIDLIFVALIVFKIYRPGLGDRSYQFTYLVFNLLIFFLCHLMVRVDLGLGFAFGLFALFSIMRYRTMTIHIKEMTYLFVVISIGVINSIYGGELSLFEIFLINGVITSVVFVADRKVLKPQASQMQLTYEKIEWIHQGKTELLIQDLQERTGLSIQKVEVVSINFMNDTALLNLFFTPQASPGRTEVKKYPQKETQKTQPLEWQDQ